MNIQRASAKGCRSNDFFQTVMVWLLRPSDKHEEMSFEPVQARVGKFGTIAEERFN